MTEHHTPSKIVVDVFTHDNANNTRNEHSIRLPSIDDWQLNLISLNKKIGKTFQIYHGYALKINDSIIACDDFQALKSIVDERHGNHATELPKIEIVEDSLLPSTVAAPLQTCTNYRAITVHHKHARHTFTVPIDIHESDEHIYTELLADIERRFQMKRNNLKLYEMYDGKKLDITDWDDLYESLQEKNVAQVLHLYVNTLIMIASDNDAYARDTAATVSAVCSAPIFENAVFASSKQEHDECMDRSGKVVLLGDSGVGKSSIEQRFVWNRFSDYKEPTVGAMFSRRTLDYGRFRFTFEIWDTAGQDRFRSLTPLYYRNATAALIVYDITCYQSFESAIQWIHELYQYDDQIVVALCGNKLDLYNERKVLYAKAKDITLKYNLALFAETSAKTNVNITKMFKQLGGIIAKTTAPMQRNGFYVHNQYHQQHDMTDDTGWCGDGGYC